MSKYILLTLIIAVIITSCSQEKKMKNITIEDLQVVLENEDEVQLLDVRTPEEWVGGVIKNPIKIDITGDDFEGKVLEKLNKKQPVYIYCRSGGRSKIASELLLEKGFQPYNIIGGYIEWTEKNKE